MHKGLALLITVAGATTAALPQAINTNDPQNDSGTYPYVSYLQDHETINPATGNLLVTIPLIHLPGRAGDDLDLSISYNSQSLNHLSFITWPATGTAPGGTYASWGYTTAQSSYSTNITPGWSGSAPVTSTAVWIPSTCTFNPSLTLGDGATYTFGTTTNGCPGEPNVPEPTIAGDDQGLGAIFDANGPTGATFYLPNGHQYSFGNVAVAGTATPAIFDTDRNGNIITYAEPWSPGLGEEIIDTLGRTISGWNFTSLAGETQVAYQDSNGVTQHITFSYKNNGSGTSDVTLAQPDIGSLTPYPGTVYGLNQPPAGEVLSSITLPNGLSYTFEYDSLGNLTVITYPDGGFTLYAYAAFPHFYDTGSGGAIIDEMQVVQKSFCSAPSVSSNTTGKPPGNSPTCNGPLDITTYQPSLPSNGCSVRGLENGNDYGSLIDSYCSTNSANIVTTPDNTATTYTFLPIVTYAPGVQSFLNGPTCGGQIRVTPLEPVELGRVVKSENTTLESIAETYYSDNLHLYTRTTTIDGATTKTETFNYPNPIPALSWSSGCPTTVSEWNLSNTTATDSTTGSSRYTADTWNTLSFNPNAPFLPSLKTSEVVASTSSAKPDSITQYFYDSPATLTSSGATQHSAAFTGQTSFARGNLTKTQQNTGSSSSPSTWTASRSTSKTYDDSGNVTSITDGNQNTTHYSFADSWANSSCAPTSGSAAAYITSTILPDGEQTKSTFNSCTGTKSVVTDANNNRTNYSYDNSDRIVDIKYPDVYPSSSTRAELQVCYSESNICTATVASGNFVTMQSVMDASNHSKSTEIDYDGAERLTAHTVTSEPYGEWTHNVAYDSVGRLSSTSQPNPAATSNVSKTIQYDGLNRPWQVTNYDNGTVHGSYTGDQVSVTDARNSTWIDVKDVFSRLLSVQEPGGYLTQYQYNSLSGLTQVDQWGGSQNTSLDHQRTFQYDQLSQIQAATQPESGTLQYTSYDANGNLKAAVDSRGVTVSHTYDSVNRLIQTSYSDATPTACFLYGSSTQSAVTNGVGRLVAEWTMPNTGNPSCSTYTTVPGSAITSRTVQAYTPSGAVVQETQCPVYPCVTPITLTYQYDLLGNLIQSTNSADQDGLTLNRTYDNAGQLSSISDSWNGSTQYPAVLFRANATTKADVSANPYGPMGLMNAELGAASLTSANPLIAESFSYDNLGRTIGATVEGPIGPVSIPATAARGTISVSGSEQSEPQGSEAKGSIVFSGMDQTVPCPTGESGPCYDSGTITLQGPADQGSSGQPTYYSLSYNGNSTTTSIASGFVSAINSDPDRIVEASSSGPTLTLTSLLNGSNTNYSIGINSIRSEYGGSSFSATPLGLFNMTGGTTTSGSTLYDSGTVTLTGFGESVDVSWGQSSTPVTIASAIASTVQRLVGNQMTVNTDGQGDVILTATTTGPQWNGSLAVQVTFDSSQFEIPSFTIVATPMAGGANATTVQERLSDYSYSLQRDLNGNVTSVTDSVNGAMNGTYGYDALNRLQTFYSGGVLTQSWSYDAFGNLSDTGTNTTGGNVTFINYSTSNNNRIANDSMGTFSYDAAGNVLFDGVNSYAYDGAGRLCAVQNPDTHAITQYLYNAESVRTARLNGGATLGCYTGGAISPTELFVVDTAGNQVTEIGVGTGPDNWQWTRTNVFAAGGLLATFDPYGLHFHLSDWLGNRRVQVSGTTGSAELTCANNPWGTGLSCAESQYGGQPDATEHHFTGKERDTESGLDYFGARYYGSNMGRMMSPDSGVDQHPEDPQTWNLYSYGRNNPLAFVDPTGEYVCGSNVSSQQCDNFQKGLDEAQKGANALKDKYGADSSQYKDAQRAIDSYGKQNVDNGVTIMAGKAGSDSLTQVANTAGPQTADNPNGQKITVTLGTDKLDGSEGNGLDIGHEGSHVADGSAWVSSGFSPSMDPTRYGTEFRAFQVERNLAEGINWGPLGFNERSGPVYIWKPGWTPAQVNAGINSELRQHYNLTPNSKVLAFQQNTQGGH